MEEGTCILAQWCQPHFVFRSCHVPAALTDQSLRSARPSFSFEDFSTFDTHDSKAKKAKRTLIQVGKQMSDAQIKA